MKQSERVQHVWSPVAQRVGLITVLSVTILAAGTVGYRCVSDGTASWLDSLYMTVITVLTIGYGEVVDLSANPAGRVFTMVIAFCGIAVVGYALSTVTAFAVGGELRGEWRKWKMQKTIESLTGHYILCGWGAVAWHIADELQTTGRSCVVVAAREGLHGGADPAATHLFIEGDPCDENILRQAGIERAAGLFAAIENDPVNIVICMTARQLNAGLRIVALAADPKNDTKFRKAGADAVVNAVRIGGLRMASEMVRPTAVSFLDIMLRDRSTGLRIEEASVGKGAAGRRIGDLPWREWTELLLVAVRVGDEWKFNPPADWVLQEGQRLIVMGTPESRDRLQTAIGG
jgi:voltage-gated potassium channel